MARSPVCLTSETHDGTPAAFPNVTHAMRTHRTGEQCLSHAGRAKPTTVLTWPGLFVPPVVSRRCWPSAIDDRLSLYAPSGVVQDPVGPSNFDPEGLGHHGLDHIGAFWDTAIAPADAYEFEVETSFAAGNEVAHVLRIHLLLPESKQMDVDSIAVYRVDPDSGSLLSMRTYWEAERAYATLRDR